MSKQIAKAEAKPLDGKIIPPIPAMSASEMDKAIVSLTNRGKKMKIDTHRLCVGFLKHYSEHGDMSKGLAIKNAIEVAYTKGTAAAFVRWCMTYAPSLDWRKEKFVHRKGMDRSLVSPKNGPMAGSICDGVPIFAFVQENRRVFDFKAMLIRQFKTLVTKLGENYEEGKKHLVTHKDAEDLQGFLKTHLDPDTFEELPAIPVKG
jgi:hypothetical protein